MSFGTMKYILFGLLFTFLITSCNETKDLPEETPEQNKQGVTSGDYVQSALPSLVGYISEKKGGISQIISHELKSDLKSSFVALIYKTDKGDIGAVNFHFSGEYNKTGLSVKHPFIVSCESDDDCNSCGFKTTDEGTVCGCGLEGKSSPCLLAVDHVTDYDFFANYNDSGLEIIKKLGEKK
ncbi:MAG: hypothetical protein RO257_01530 [Candidatus Kapabacteria bacterium]|jgi:hypothetical protein|nr:hypothetical protein [Candidatus Kapabacteria bacterium]